MFSPSKRNQYSDQITNNIEKMGKKSHRKMFIKEHADTNQFGEPLFRLDQQDLKWTDKRNQYQARQESYIKQFSPKKRSKSQLLYDHQISDFVSANDRDHLRIKNGVHQFPKKKIVKDRLNESCLNIFASNTSTQNNNVNLNASVQFWNKPRLSVSPFHNRSSSIMIDSFCQDKNRSPREELNRSPQQINPNYINRFKNTNVILGINDSSPQPQDKGIRTYHDHFPVDTNILHLVNKTSQTGFNHNISYQINDRSRENSQTNARVFNLGSETTPSFHKNGIKTFFQQNSESGKGLPNPVTGQNMKKDRPLGLRMVNTSAKKSQHTFDSIYNSMSEFSPEKNVGIKCKINNNQQKINPIVMFDASDPNQPPASARKGRKVFTQRNSPSPVKFLLQQPNANTDMPTQVNNTNLNTNNPNTAANGSTIIQNNSINLLSPNLETNTSANGQLQNQQNRIHKKLVDAYPKSNQPSQFNYLAYQNSSLYTEKYKDQQEKYSKGSFGKRNKSPHMRDVMYSESTIKNSILTSASKHNISINNNAITNMNNSQINLNNSQIQCDQFNDEANESVMQQKKIQLPSQQENINDTPAKKSSQKSTQHQQSQQQQPSQSQQQQHSSSQMSVSGRSSKKYHPDKSFNGNQSTQALNLSQVKQAVKMGEIQGVKKIYDFESFKNKYR